jgi:hypothetical protein
MWRYGLDDLVQPMVKRLPTTGKLKSGVRSKYHTEAFYGDTKKHQLFDREERSYEILHILAPTGLTLDAQKAVDYAVALPRDFGVRLTLLHVYNSNFGDGPKNDGFSTSSGQRF